jgi:glucan phosphoethanolaminetransferase (alkaline phosphatase superfamily)
MMKSTEGTLVAPNRTSSRSAIWCSPWAAWAALLAIDLVTRAVYLAPRLVTFRGLANYVVASAALWIVVRLLAALPLRPRVVLFAIVIATPMAVQSTMFRSFGQFVETTDFVALWATPNVVLRAASGGGDRATAFVVFVVAASCAWLLPRQRLVLPRWRAALAALLLASALGTGATYWRASPSLEHSQPAFCCALVGLMRRATAAERGARRVVIPPAPPAAGAAPLPNIVLVLGESLAASHLTLYGYERDTSPRLQALKARDELVVMRDAVVMGPHTRTSVPYIMTGLAGPDPKGRVFGSPNVLQYAKSRGYHTAFVSAQEESWGDLDAILREGADIFKSGIDFAANVDVLKGCDDLVVLEQGVLPTLRTLKEPFFLVVHMDGSHVPYADHSPASHKVFPEDGANSMGAYDNTIRVTDEYLARVFEALRARDPRAYMFFTSDHGQALGEGGAFYHRGYQSNVVRDPLLVFPPRGDAQSRATWSELADAQVSACDLAPTILHVMGATPSPAAPMDCTDLLAGPPRPRVRVVSAYTPAFIGEPTLLVLMPDGQRALYDLWRGTVTMNDGAARPMAELALPPEVAARLVVQ